MSDKGKGGGETILAGLVLAYLDAAQQARTERVRIFEQEHTRRHAISWQAKCFIAQEKQITERTRIEADKEMAQAHEKTRRVEQQCLLAMERTRAQTDAFDALCNAVRQSLRSGDLTLDNIRRQFSDVCRILIEHDIEAAERTLLLGFLNELLAQQKEVAVRQTRLFDRIGPGNRMLDE